MIEPPNLIQLQHEFFYQNGLPPSRFTSPVVKIEKLVFDHFTGIAVHFPAAIGGRETETWRDLVRVRLQCRLSYRH